MFIAGCGTSTSDATQASPSQTVAIVHIQGILATGGTFDGTLTYNPKQEPIGINVRGLEPNEIFQVLAYEFEVHPNDQSLPGIIMFDVTFSDHEIEFCIGQCVFSSVQTRTVTVSNAGYRLQTSFHADTWGVAVLEGSRFQWKPNGEFYDAFTFMLSEWAWVA